MLRLPREADPAPPVRKGEREEPVRKGERDRSEKVNGERSEKVNGIRIKTELKTDHTAAAAGRTPAAAAAASGTTEPGTTASPTALESVAPGGVRRADGAATGATPVPRGHPAATGVAAGPPLHPQSPGPAAPGHRGGLAAARGRAGDHGPAPGPALREPLLRRLPRQPRRTGRRALPQGRPTGGEVPRTPAAAPGQPTRRSPSGGAGSASFMRAKHQRDARAQPNLSFALVLHGDEFLRAVQNEPSARQPDASGGPRGRNPRPTCFSCSHNWSVWLSS